MFFDASQGSLMAKIATISHPLAKIVTASRIPLRPLKAVRWHVSVERGFRRLGDAVGVQATFGLQPAACEGMARC